MKLSTQISLFFFASILFSLAGCIDRPRDPERFRNDVETLVNRLGGRGKTSSTSLIDDLNLLRGISSDTLWVLSREISDQTLKEYLVGRGAQKTLDLYHAVRSRFDRGYLTTASQIASPQSPVAQISDNETHTIESALRPVYSSIVSRSEISSWSVEDKVRTPHYCRNECACVASNLGAGLRQAFPNRNAVLIYFSSGSPQGGVTAYTGTEMTRRSWMYHVALAVESPEMSWVIVDPIIFRNLKPHTLEDWKGRFETTELVTYLLKPID